MFVCVVYCGCHADCSPLFTGTLASSGVLCPLLLYWARTDVPKSSVLDVRHCLVKFIAACGVDVRSLNSYLSLLCQLR